MKIVRSLFANVIFCWWLLFLFAYFQFWMIIKFQGVSISSRNLSIDNILSLLMIFLILWVLFRILNFPLKNILKLLTIPVNALTLGLFSLILNVIVFYLFQYIANNYLHLITSFSDISIMLGNFWQTLVLSFLMSLWLTILNKLFN